MRQIRQGMRRRARGLAALAALVLLAVGAALAAGLWADGCAPAAAAPHAPAGPTALDAATSHSLPGPACELRALPARPVIAHASVVEALPAPPLGGPVGLAPLASLAPPRDTIPLSQTVTPLQHPPNPAVA
ncbi:MAG TPA: hypothetical protein VII06_18810 [Chloroflexota bacterium]